MMKLLIVDDDEVMRKLLQEVLTREGYAVELAASGEEAVRFIQKETFPIIISDIRMLEMDGIGVLRTVKKLEKRSAVILMTGFGSMEGAIEAIQEGAFDYVSKPFQMSDIKTMVAKAAKHWESLSAQKSPASPSRPVDLSSQVLIGRSPRIVEVYKTLARAALSSSNVLVAGESGTGKEMVARAIHENSARSSKRFVTVNCGAQAEPFLETELFKSGGAIEESSHGTLFLDEIGDLSPGLQIRMLRAVQEGKFRAAGSSEERPVDLRVVAATHLDLESLVRSGRFREDLYYRLNVISIELPPLRDRLEDLPQLVEFFIARYAEKNRKSVSHVSEDAMSMLRAYPWPGNIRELEHAIERAVAMTGASVLFPEDFPREISRSGEGAQDIGGAASAPAVSLEDMERAHIIRVLQDVGFNKSKASEVLGIDRATLYRKAQRYQIDLRGR